MVDSLFCPIRKTWVAALPEEKVRQTLIQHMTEELGFPASSLVIEKNLHQLPHLQTAQALPNRRADMIVFARNIHPQHPFYPLLLIECKAVKITDKTLRQLIGYNQYVGAPFIAAVNEHQSLFGWFQAEKKDFIFKEGFLSYEVLMRSIARRS